MSSISKIQADRDYRQLHQTEGKVLKPLPVDNRTLLQQGSDLEASIDLLQADVDKLAQDEKEVPKEFESLFVEARRAVSIVGGYCQ